MTARSGYSERLATPGPAVVALLVAAVAALPAAMLAPAATRGSAGLAWVPVDRWLVVEVEPGAAANPLAAADELVDPARPVFPDRGLVVGPGRWNLVRRDGESEFSAADTAGAGGDATGARAVLAHAYLESDRDGTLVLVLDAPDCLDAGLWLNGQELPREGGLVRLGTGWNTLLVAMSGNSDCPPRWSASLGGETGDPGSLTDRDQALDPAEVRVQASRPPGQYRQFPNGWITFDSVRVESLTWSADSRDLEAQLSYSVTSWGGFAPRSAAGRGGRGGAVSVDGRPGGRGAGGGRQSGAPGGSAIAGQDGFEADPQRMAMIAVVRGDFDQRRPAPTGGSVRIDVAGEEVRSWLAGLRPGAPRTFTVSVPLRNARLAAARQDRLRLRAEWPDARARELRGTLPSAGIDRALRGRIAIDGLTRAAGGSGRLEGTLRIPDDLDGFKVRAVGGEWTVDGMVAGDGVLCSPCRRGRTLGVTALLGEQETPAVSAVEAG